MTTIIDIWMNEFLLPRLIKGELNFLDFKPMNCNKCLAFWFGLIFSIIFLNPVYMGIYLLTRFLK